MSVIVGVGVMLMTPDNKVLMGQRKKGEFAGCWCFPGGKLDHGESIMECARRETMEETNLEIGQSSRVFNVANDRVSEDLHSITFGVIATAFSGDLYTNEPDTIANWKWIAVGELPGDLFPPTQSILHAYRAHRAGSEPSSVDAYLSKSDKESFLLNALTCS